LHRVVWLLSALLLLAAPALPQTRRGQEPQTGQLDSSKTLFAVMAAIDAGGFDAESGLPSAHPVRKALRAYIGKTLPSIDALKRYVRDHRPKNAAAEFSQYVSFALLSKGPPDFGWTNPNLPPPPDVATIDDLAPLLADFYREANIEALWREVQPYYDRAIEQYTEPVSRGVLQVNAYLRNPTSGYLGRRFQIFVDLLGVPSQVQNRHYLDDDYVVVTPYLNEDYAVLRSGLEIQAEDIRHAYLHYLADPLGLKFAAELKKKAALGDYALGSPLIEEQYKTDFIRLATECFIKAVEARMARKPALAQQALREGFVVTPALFELLGKYEQQDLSMRLYFPDMVTSIDLKKEEKRLDHIDFVSERPTRTIRVTQTVTPAEPVLTGAAKTLDEAEQAYAARDLARAKQIYLRVLQETAGNPMHAKAYYGLARIAVLERDPETGDRLFRKVLELDPDAATRSWSLLYLGRLADSQGEREQAQEHYKAALAVEGVPDSVRQAAEKGLKEAFSRN
jgi:tetratricopeptide (TPR) repeat protein